MGTLHMFQRPSTQIMAIFHFLFNEKWNSPPDCYGLKKNLSYSEIHGPNKGPTDVLEVENFKPEKRLRLPLPRKPIMVTRYTDSKTFLLALWPNWNWLQDFTISICGHHQALKKFDLELLSTFMSVPRNHMTLNTIWSLTKLTLSLSVWIFK